MYLYNMKKIVYCLFSFLLFHGFCQAQETTGVDSSKTLNEVVITAFEQGRTISCGTVVKVIDHNNADRYNKTSLVNSFNSLAGVRMEERSPGSYRINIRGSSLRSPFGVRNVKIYWNDLPVTDAGGNTYFNEFAFNNFSSIEVVKGPAGSMYGAGTGGLLLMHSFASRFEPSVKLDYVTGSYNLQNLLASVSFGTDDRRNIISYAHNQSDGYRYHSSSRKDNASFVSQLKISEKQLLTTSVLFTDLRYETPGGLNKNEFLANPRQSRPAAGGLPSADQAKAAIFQKTFLAGINQQYFFGGGFKNSTSLYGSYANIKNPTFRNYERRTEPGYGGRTVFTYEKKMDDTKLQLVAGGEWQEGFFNTLVSKNKQGNQDSVQTNDDIRFTALSGFAQADISIKDDWFITAGASINSSKVNVTRVSKYPVVTQRRTYKNEWSPRLAIQKKIGSNHSVFASVSKGFSPPSIAEVLPSTGVISTFLEAEQGTNYELGARSVLFSGRLRLDATLFYFKLNNALVVRKDSSNADYYVNAGDIKQKGIELNIDYTLPFYGGFLDYFTLQGAYTYSDFSYGTFKKDTVNYGGRQVPGVGKNTISVLADIQSKKGIYINVTYYYASKIFLDDANSASANPYHLLGSRLGWKSSAKNKWRFNVYAGVDNLLDETYSLGNDINAMNGRFYNAAAKRNYYAGLSIQYNKKKQL